MAFVQRDAQRNIQGVFRQKQEGVAEEELADDDPAVVAFNARASADPTLRRIHPYYFRLRFSKAQRIAFATSTDPDVIDLSEAFRSADTIGLDDPRTNAGLNLLIAKGIIQAGDKAALLADRKVSEKP